METDDDLDSSVTSQCKRLISACRYTHRGWRPLQQALSSSALAIAVSHDDSCMAVDRIVCGRGRNRFSTVIVMGPITQVVGRLDRKCLAWSAHLFLLQCARMAFVKSQPNQSFTGRQYASMTCDVRTGGREGETIKQAILVKILVLSNKTNEAPNGQLDMSMAVACRSPPSDPSTSTNY